MAGLSCSSYAILILFAMAFVLEISQGNVLSTASVATATIVKPLGGEGSLKKEQCGPACAYRCSETSHKKPCLFYCNKCCATCLCVPSGTSGNKEECPCYNNWKTKEGKPKCP